jgi:hypothetical protein
MKLYKTNVQELAEDNLNFYTLEGGKEGDYYSFGVNSTGEVVARIPLEVTLVFTDTHFRTDKGGIIRRFYSVNEEFSIINQGIVNPLSQSYMDYRALVEAL